MKIVLISNLVLWLMLFFAVVQVFGQERTITPDQFFKTRTSAMDSLGGKTYRSKTETVQNDGRSHISVIFESVPPASTRILTVNTFDGVVKKTEIIEIGENSYIRLGDGPWKSPNVPDERNFYTVSPDKSRAKIERTVTYALTADTDLGNQKADLYSQRDAISHESPGSSYKSVIVNRLWISKEGLLLKSEYTVHDGSGKSNYSSVIVYEYDPKIKIKAPAVKRGAKGK